MVEYILTCSCHNMDKKALEAYSILFPGKTPPEIIRGRDRIYKLSQSLNNEHIKAISRLSGKFAYHIALKDGIISKEYDLLKGVRIS